ncbi:hypothetical protein LEP1GSC193_1808 [Leptospira alstonii serovar Pingchang str. 80-412]|uniref:Uncharacterized protein n=2 Tax=Leptospira alstonii TaxID=28452 RepID=M6D5R8_9LEPT|nr:hypothetical protein LEP1GSC194_4422 [Leptospira alstonii serovar Sichuan str. 79601]EQA78633.1 hypothetical protein LEP1GSC193_1808 [Leptospira alstonii serovar Pingchang str. 80-412]
MLPILLRRFSFCSLDESLLMGRSEISWRTLKRLVILNASEICGNSCERGIYRMDIDLFFGILWELIQNP